MRALLGVLGVWTALVFAAILAAAMKGKFAELAPEFALVGLGGGVCVAGMLLAWIWPPSPSATVGAAAKLLWVRPWRRVLFAATGTSPFWAIVARDWVEKGEFDSVTPIMLGIAVVIGWTMGRERLQYSDASVDRIGGIGPKQSVRWDEVVAIDAAYTGVSLFNGTGRWVGVAGCMLEGFPEFAATALARLPAAAFERSPGAREKLEMIALRFELPEGE
jgi:hypothetical protein